MAYNDTRITVCGIVASKITHTKVGTGFSRAGFRVHSRERRYDRDRDDWISGPDMFLMVTCWRDLADNVHASLNRGDPVVVHGKVRIREFDDNGRTRQAVDIEATAVGPNLVSCTAHPVRDRAEEGPVVVAPRKEDEPTLAFAGVSLNRTRPPEPTSQPAPPRPAAVPRPGSSPESGLPPEPAVPASGRPTDAEQPQEVSQAPG